MQHAFKLFVLLLSVVVVVLVSLDALSAGGHLPALLEHHIQTTVQSVGTWNSPGNKLTGIPSPALLLGAAILRLSISILQSTGLTRGPGWDSGCVCARAKEQLQGCDRRVGVVGERGSVKTDRDAPERGTWVEPDLSVFLLFITAPPAK